MKTACRGAIALLSIALSPAVSATEPRFELPIDCEPGLTCVVQNYVDRDAGPGARDFACGAMTYDGHDGVDFRLPSLEAQRRGVEVRAALGGVVRGIRDGMADVAVTGGSKPPEIQGRECGNGVVVTHADGWETQYCHMAKGSVRVRTGQTVETGTVLGRVGLSGNTAFPHLHVTIRRGGKPVDPFALDAGDERCGAGRTAWTDKVAAALAYRSPHVLNAGFAAGPVEMEAIEDGRPERLGDPSPAAPGLVAYARAIGLRAGDRLVLDVIGPDGTPFARNATDPLDRPKAQHMLFTGRKRPPGGWTAGVYKATFWIERDGRRITEHAFSTTLAP